MIKKYVVASCKPWHEIEFLKHSKKLSGIWKLVSNQKQLLKVVKKYNPNFIFFLHWNWIVPSKIWETTECVCFHITDLPYGRGGTPLQNLILKKRRKTKVTAFKMVKELDAGPVYLKRNLLLNGTAKQIYVRAGKICWSIIRTMISRNIVPSPQKGKVTKFQRRHAAERILPSTGGLKKIYDFIRMLDAPTYPLAFLKHGKFYLEFSKSKMKRFSVDAKVRITRMGK